MTEAIIISCSVAIFVLIMGTVRHQYKMLYHRYEKLETNIDRQFSDLKRFIEDRHDATTLTRADMREEYNRIIRELSGRPPREQNRPKKSVEHKNRNIFPHTKPTHTPNT